MCKLSKHSTITAIVFIGMLITGFTIACCCRHSPGAQIVETAVESAIKAETGISIDFDAIVDKVSDDAATVNN